MTLDEKIEVMQAAKRGERIQHRKIAHHNDNGWTNAPTWRDLPAEDTRINNGYLADGAFNFGVFEYRIAPRNATSIVSRKGTHYEVTANEDGSITFGCETIEKRDVDAIFALRFPELKSERRSV